MSDKPRSNCIEWTGSLSPRGYGILYFNNSLIGVHRLAWAIANGRMPRKNMDICHKCDNRKCVNPKHLFEGTRSDNMKDAVLKGRMFAPNRNKKFCIRGHEFTKENTYIRKSGNRACLACHQMHSKNWRKKVKNDKD